MNTTRWAVAWLCLAAMITLGLSAAQAAELSVKVWEEPMTIPTYQYAEPDLCPLFYDGRTYQGAKGPFYPYPIIDRLLNVKKDEVYKAVYLENQYLKICVLPELGGRIFEAVDKANHYDFFYRQHVIKPALIGMLGAWISGGVEWNIPHHHRATSFAPVSYKTDANPDGSKTVWVGEMELRHRMRWLVGLTLHPDKAYLEGTVRLINRTPVSHSFLYFANVAVHTNPSYQVIFPPSVQFATQHSKSEFTRWPVGEGTYGSTNYKGVDESWWKNHPRPVSMFAHECQEDFLAGYDHGRKAGTLHVADHSILPGKKFFTWGTGAEGQVWDKTLTDSDGPYLELMVGGFSDNQPDYSWIQPYEVKEVKHCWYPFQQIGGVKNATREAAVNLDVTPQSVARVGFCATAEYRDARVLVRATSETLLEERVTIAPGKPYLKEIKLPAGVKEEDLRVSLSIAGKELVAYKPARIERQPMPSPVVPPAPPRDIKTNEELYLAGTRLQQFYNPAREPEPYFEEALKRDPADYRANVALGIVLYNRGLFKEAEEKFQAAVAHVTRNYTAPRDGEALYYLGLALKAQGKNDAAYDAFYKATWSSAWHTAGFYALAELACMKGNAEQALEFLDRSLSADTRNTKALNLKSAVLRQLRRFGEAEKSAFAASALDPVDLWAKREYYLAKGGEVAKGNPRPAIRITSNLFEDVQPCLEIAVDFANAGLWAEGVSVLTELVEASRIRGHVHPMVYYYRGYLADRQGKLGNAFDDYRVARQANPNYCFPFRLEEIAVLRRAMEVNPKDARAPYYLGNLLYDLQPAEAVKMWEKSRSLDDSFALVHRNLGWAYARTENSNAKAIASLEKAVSLWENARLLGELDRMYEDEGAPASQRLAMLEKHHKAVLERDDVLSREVRLKIQSGQYDDALALLGDRRWNVWEGGASVHDLYVDALLLRGQQSMKEKKYKDALKDYEAALEYPENFSVGRPSRGDKSPMINYYIGSAYEALADADKAKAAYQKSVAETGEGGRGRRGGAGDRTDIQYCQARAWEKLGEPERAQPIFKALIEFGQGALKGGATEDFFAKFGERQSRKVRLAQAHYALGLGYLGTGKEAEAKSEFEKALELNANHLGAMTKLSALAK
jgi:tetratricopeptide (TPR) repeat protein